MAVLPDKVTVSIDRGVELAGDVFKFLTNLVHPVTQFINSLSDAGWFGIAAVFMLFFMLRLARSSLKSGNPVQYGTILVYIGERGLMLCGIYLALLTVEYIIMPPLVILATCLYNSVSGNEPGIFQLVSFLATGSDARAEFLHDTLQFYGTSHSLLPLGVRAFGLIAVAILSIWTVGRALTSLRASDQ